jgi:hypothetical protein
MILVNSAALKFKVKLKFRFFVIVSVCECFVLLSYGDQLKLCLVT